MGGIVAAPEMTVLLGAEASTPCDGRRLPTEPVAFDYRLADPARPAQVDLGGRLDQAGAHPPVVRLLVARAACARLGAVDCAEGPYHLPSELAAMVIALRDCAMRGEAAEVYRAAKSAELLVETIERLRGGLLVPVAGEGALSLADCRRVVTARAMIDERWSEKLTIGRIAREVGLNRGKLTRGFRELFACTVAEAIAERRMTEARRMLLTTDLPVAAVGYENGYLSNASFARAFGRRFGTSPSGCRAAT